MQCSVCGERTWNEYCSNACKQKAYRLRKKQKKLAEKETVNMEVYDHVDKILEMTHYESRDSYSAQLWALVDSIDSLQTKLDVLIAIQVGMLASGCI